MTLDMASKDGSPVGLYAVMPLMGELDVITAVGPSGCSVLELGAGAGRVTHAMVDAGYRVTAVDNSAEMLEHITGARKVQANIEDLHLPDRFDLVLLASNLINVLDPSVAARMLACTRRHVSEGGRVLIQRLNSKWAQAPVDDEVQVGPLTMRTEGSSRSGDIVTARVTYVMGERQWSHAFSQRILDDEAILGMLEKADLELEYWVDLARSWFTAIARK